MAVAASGVLAVANAVGAPAPRQSRPAAIPIPTGPYTVDVANRESVRQFYNVVHESVAGVTANWSGGSLAGCQAGTVQQDFIDTALSRTNYFRAMAGVPSLTVTDANNAEAQTAALWQAANPPGLNHRPPAGTPCWSQAAADGSFASSLSETSGSTIGPERIDSLMYDGTSLGHRRNMLNPSITTTGFGAIPKQPTSNGFLTQLVLTPTLANRPATRSGFVAWPPDGFVPYEVVPARWSFSLPGADFSHATVSMSRNGATVPAQIRCFDPWPDPTDVNCGLFGESAISWTANNMADGADWPKPAADDTFTVTVGNVLTPGNATGQSFTYHVTVIDPAVADATHSMAQATPQGPTSPTVGSNPTFTVAPPADATGFQWRTSPLSPGDLFDGAENGLTNFTANVSPAYNPISTLEHSTGASSFRLSSQGTFTPLAAPLPQTLTLNKSLFIQPNSQLTFDSMYVNGNAQTVELSTDGGTTWTPVFQEDSTTFPGVQTSFTPRTVSLAAFAGHIVNLRFREATVGGQWFNCCNEPNGWYIDNIALSNVQTAGTPTLSAVQPNPSFTFANSQPGTVAIDARPQFTNPSVGGSFGDWSKAFTVTSVNGAGVVSVASSANPSSGGQQVTFTATVTPAAATGTVSFADNGTAIASCQSIAMNVSNQATCLQTYDAGSTHSIVATYNGDGNFTAAPSPALTQTVNAPQFVTGTVTATPTSVKGGQPVTVTATVAPTDGGGTVSFTSNLSVITGCGAVPLNAAGTATCTFVTDTNPGHPLLEAQYSGDVNFLGTSLGSTQILVSVDTATTVTASANPLTTGQQVTYTATVTPNNSFGEIDFYDNGAAMSNADTTCVQLAPDGNGRATCTWTYSGNGPHAIRATFTGFDGLTRYGSSASIPLSESVGTLQATSTALTSSVNPSTVGQAVTYTATVTGGGGGGTVEFSDRGTPITGCESIAPDGQGKATCAQTYTDTTPHSIVATYLADTTFAGSSSPAVAQTVTQPVPPAAQGVAAANVGGGAVQVGFTAPGGARPNAAVAAAGTPASVTGYNVYMGNAPGAESATPVNSSRILATAKGFTVTGLTAGQHYYFFVRTSSNGRLGPKSHEVSVLAATAPGAPPTVTATGAAESVRLGWGAAATGGSPITGYDVYAGTGSGHEATKPLNATPLPASARGYNATRLSDGTKYFFVVRAVSAAGAGRPSAEASASPVGVPRQVSNLAAYGRNASAVLTWVAPSQDGSAYPVTGYNVYKGTAAGTEAPTPVNASPLPRSTTTYTAAGLTNAKKYFFVVKAVNAAGVGAASNESSAVPTSAATAPGAPRGLTASAAAASVKLTWAAPAATGGKPITGYNVFKGSAAGGESATPVNSSPLPASATTYTVAGLANGVAYWFVVKAVNTVGSGIPSNEASAMPATAATFPGSPRALHGAGGSHKVTLTWSAPVWNGGSAITGYNVYVGTAPGSESPTPVNPSLLAEGATTYAVTGLVSHTRHYFVVKAVNAVGASVASNEASATAS